MTKKELLKYLSAMQVIDFNKLGFRYAKETIDEALNLIQKQQVEINSLKNLNNHQGRDVQKAVDYTFELNKELEKQDKIIDAMLEEYEYDARINVKNFCEEKLRKDTCIQDCKLCIKQYFEKQVESEDKQ